jgi:hypothetical protein
MEKIRIPNTGRNHVDRRRTLTKLVGRLDTLIQTKNNLIIFVFSYKPEPWEEIYTAHPIGKLNDLKYAF